MNKERIAIVGLKPKPGKEQELIALVKTHIEILRKEGLASDRTPIVMQAKDGTIIEVFGWASKEAIETAHSNPVVLKMWEDYARVCDYIPIGEVEESKELFSEFAPL